MISKKSLSIALSMSFVAALLFAAGCKDTPKTDTTTTGSTESQEKGPKCADHNGDKDKCEKAKQGGKECKYDDATKKCSLPGGGGGGGGDTDCEKLDEKTCLKSDQCHYAAGKCSDATKTGCSAIQEETACDDKGSCEWAGGVCKDKVASSDVFTWTKAPLPADADPADVTQLVVSGDNNHLYAYNNKAGKTKGLYHSDDKGQTWTRVGPGGNGIVSGRPFTGKTVLNRDLDTTSLALTMKATQGGVVLYSGKLMIIMVGKDAKWGFNAHKSYDGKSNSGRYNIITSLKDENIKFVDVVNTHAGESVVFGQISPNTVFIADANGTVSATSAPKHFATKLIAGTPLAQTWIRAGNTHDGHLLLASANGVWEFPKANTDPATAAEFGKTDSDTPKLFPEADAAGVNWKTTNVDIRVIGSFDDDGTHHYFAGLADGLAHHKGAQVAPAHAALSFAGDEISHVNQDNGVIRLITSHGVKGVSVEGVPHTASDFKAGDLANNKHEMNADKTAISEVKAADNDDLVLLGDAKKSVVWVKTRGIWIREKSSGQPRP